MQEYYNEGFSAFTDGLDYTDNPYPIGSTRYEGWQDGWAAAQDEDSCNKEYERYADWI